MEQDLFQFTADRYRALFYHLIQLGIVKEMSFLIDSKDFDDKYCDQEDVRDAAPFKDMFDQLMAWNGSPCLYRWEIISPYDSDEIKQAVENLPKHTPHVSKNATTDDNTLYVGKSEGCIYGRIIEHLGYHRNKACHGLQLHYWAKDMHLRFCLHVTVLQPDCLKEPWVMEIFETALANEHKPLIGIH